MKKSPAPGIAPKQEEEARGARLHSNPFCPGNYPGDSSNLQGEITIIIPQPNLTTPAPHNPYSTRGAWRSFWKEKDKHQRQELSLSSNLSSLSFPGQQHLLRILSQEGSSMPRRSWSLAGTMGTATILPKGRAHCFCAKGLWGGGDALSLPLKLFLTPCRVSPF